MYNVLQNKYRKVPEMSKRTGSAKASSKRLGASPRREKMNRKIEHLIERFRTRFPNGAEIQPVDRSDRKPNDWRRLFTVITGPRLIRPSVDGAVMTIKAIERLIRQEASDELKKAQWEAEAREHGAVELRYEVSQNGTICLVYRSRTGFEKRHSIQRARETSWGQRGFNKGEKLCAAIFALLFPIAKWQLNQRYEFLRFEGSRLELDGYCEELKIAFEHQGRQHYSSTPRYDRTPEDFERRKKRDAFKVARCRELGIRLAVIPQVELDPERCLQSIGTELRRLEITFDPTVSVSSVVENWQRMFRNVTEHLQASVVRGIGIHELIAPPLEQIHAGTTVQYKCGNCGSLNMAHARGFSSGAARKLCPNCKTQNRWSRRQEEQLKHLRDQYPEVLRPYLRIVNKTKLFLVCHNNHQQRIPAEEGLGRVIKNGTYWCLHCQAESLGAPEGGSQWRQRVGTVIQHREKFQETIGKAGLILIGEVRHDGDGNSGKLVAKVRCPTGHEFDVRMDELSLLLRNKYVSDRTIVPHVCEACCYPGMIGIARKATVFHRLAYLRHRLPNVRYVSGFDGTGKGMEEFNCGERFESTGDPHPNFFHRWHTALKTNVEDFRTPCLVCACKRGESLPVGAKTLEMIEGRMKLIDEALAEIVGRELYAPSVSLVPHEPGAMLVERN
jgi:hypothetical protein